MAMVGMVLLAGCGQNIAEPVEEIVVATVTPTATATPFPTHTPTATPEPTSAPTATGTPLPPPTPLPEVVLEVSGPEIVPAGLPQAVEWSISVIDGAELVIVSIDDLGGVMLSGDDADQLDLVKTLVPANTANVAQSFDSVWIISGVIDPNIGQGVLTLLMETGLYQEVVTLPWVSSAVEEVEYRTYAIPLDGLNQEPVLNVDSESEVSRPGFNRYETINGLQFEHPQAWVINEFQDGIVQLSPDPLAAADGASLQDVPYATLIAGDRAAVGIPLTVDLDPESIIDWLLGDVTPVGGEQAGLFLSDELEVVRRGSLELGDNSSTGDVILKPVQGEDAAEARYIVSVKSDDRLVILSAFDPEGNFFVELDEVISSLEFK